ncbi:hypothetical protein [Methylobacterium bullatum]|uniref:Uncharacterized protein n=1 Tax=Methylobacterium bullatum TaxID=570505 RepID=A0A679JJM5_9HYPH|nr:hypothetical protein MBLL_00787 [Methylobacterium bullatum]
MIIQLGGHLERAFLLAGKRESSQQGRSEEPQTLPHATDAYRSFFHRAGTIAVLSKGIIDPNAVDADDAALKGLHVDGRYVAMSQRSLEEDAWTFTKRVVTEAAFSPESMATMRLRAPDDPRPEGSIPHHLDDIINHCLAAWRTDSTLVLADCDRQVLVELAACVYANGLALPFAIPDLRKMPTGSSRASGQLANLQPSNITDVGTLRNDPAVKAYATRLQRLSESAAADVSAILRTALSKASDMSQRIRESPRNLTLTNHWAKVLNNFDVSKVAMLKDPSNWAERRYSTKKMHVIVLSSPYSLI